MIAVVRFPLVSRHLCSGFLSSSSSTLVVQRAFWIESWQPSSSVSSSVSSSSSSLFNTWQQQQTTIQKKSLRCCGRQCSFSTASSASSDGNDNDKKQVGTGDKPKIKCKMKMRQYRKENVVGFRQLVVQVRETLPAKAHRLKTYEIECVMRTAFQVIANNLEYQKKTSIPKFGSFFSLTHKGNTYCRRVLSDGSTRFVSKVEADQTFQSPNHRRVVFRPAKTVKKAVRDLAYLYLQDGEERAKLGWDDMESPSIKLALEKRGEEEKKKNVKLRRKNRPESKDEDDSQSDEDSDDDDEGDSSIVKKGKSGETRKQR